MTEPETPPSAQETENRDDQIVRYRRRLEEVADLVARIRHEINNPLTGVLGQAQLLLREDLSDRARKRAVTIEELAMRIRDIVAQLREVQRPTTGEDNEAASSAGPGV
jgi:signal transduction histidine kinase